MGTTHTLGNFLPWGNAGNITFLTNTEETAVGGYSGIYFDASDPGNITLTGNVFFFETVGWTNIMNNTVTPPTTGNSLLDPWMISGLAWSENAGWMTLDALDPNSYS
jgi:hypothetical protein